jgi:hypothetical protein
MYTAICMSNSLHGDEKKGTKTSANHAFLPVDQIWADIY